MVKPYPGVETGNPLSKIAQALTITYLLDQPTLFK